MPEEVPTTGETPINFESWIETQPDEVKALLDGHIKGLKTALDSEREARRSFEKQVRELAAKAEQGSEAQKQLIAMADQVQALTRQQTFYDEAHARGVNNLKLAYLAAQNDGLMDEQGRVDWERLKKSYPQLFGATGGPPQGNAGSGMQKPSGLTSMNTIIRRAAGYHE